MVHRTREDGEELFGVRNSHLINDGIQEVMGRLIQSTLHPVLSRRTKTSRRHSTLPTTHITKSTDDKHLAKRETTFKDFETAAISSAKEDSCQTPVAIDVCFAGMSSASLTLSTLPNTSNASVVTGSAKPKKKSKIARLFYWVRHFFRQTSRHESQGWLKL
ncbi:uncharacterized protein LOC124258848 [Haliotis rubra]|uniref:uncharacterized protein LOC124258848 n=1 Tax=Haliotis rubra TaxID=36100 RepID=UPI001EE581DB|nr:uncharacterized protein LOC124258848 [Haliotis rubra]